MAGDKTTSEDVHSSRVIRMVFLALLLDLLGFTLILPLLPSILDHYSQTGVRSSFEYIVIKSQRVFDWLSIQKEMLL